MRLHERRLLRLGLLSIVLLVMLVSPVLAADQEEKPPPYDVEGLTPGNLWVPWVFAFAFAGGCVAIALKNPRRTATERT